MLKNLFNQNDSMENVSIVEQGAINICKKGFFVKSDVLVQGKKHLPD